MFSFREKAACRMREEKYTDLVSLMRSMPAHNTMLCLMLLKCGNLHVPNRDACYAKKIFYQDKNSYVQIAIRIEC